MYRASKVLEKKLTEKIYLFGTTEIQEDTKASRKVLHAKEKKYSFPYRSKEARSKLDAEVIDPRNVHDFKIKLDNSRFKDGTVGT